MLEQAKRQSSPLELLRGDAIHLPYQDNFVRPCLLRGCYPPLWQNQMFLSLKLSACWRPGGALAVVGSDPHSGDDTWYVYEYFEEVLETDLQRFPSEVAILTWMRGEGFQNILSKGIEHISDVHFGTDVFNDPFLKRIPVRN